MNEWVCVLTVEAFIFGLLSTVPTAQRIDVFTWPRDHTWPVCGTGVLALRVLAHSCFDLQLRQSERTRAAH